MVARWFLLACALSGCGRGTAAGPPAETFVVHRGDLEDRFVLTGELEATTSEVLKVPRTPSYQVAIRWIIDDGAVVKKGDKIVEFDSSSFSSALTDKRLAVQRGQSDVLSETAKASAALADKQLEVERKRVALEKARVEAAVPADLRSKREHQEKQRDLLRAADALKKAEDDLAAQKRGGKLDRRVKEIALAKSVRDLKDIESRLDELVLRAPRDGLVQIAMNRRDGVRKYQLGDTTFSGSDIAVMPNLQEMQVRARLSDVDEGAIAPAMKTECEMDAHPGHALSGRILSISPVARPEGRDAIRRVFDVIVALDKTEPDLMLPGMSVRVEAVRKRVEKALLIPRAALREANGKLLTSRPGGRTEPVEVEFCGLHDCVLRKGPDEGTALSLPAAVTRSSS